MSQKLTPHSQAEQDSPSGGAPNIRFQETGSADMRARKFFRILYDAQQRSLFSQKGSTPKAAEASDRVTAGGQGCCTDEQENGTA